MVFASRNANTAIDANEGVGYNPGRTVYKDIRLKAQHRPQSLEYAVLVQGAGKSVRPAGSIGVKHTVDWYRSDGKDSAHAEWKAHMRELLNKENASSNPVRWYE